MAQIVQGYDPFTSNSDMFSRMSDDSRVMDGLADKFGGGVSKTIERMAQVRDRVKNSKTYKRSLSAVRKVRNLRREDAVLELDTIDKMQHAPRYMQEYLMADPVLAGRYNRSGMHGWENGFAKRNTKANATSSNPWYRELNDGLVRKDSNDNFITTQFVDREKHRQLEMDQKVDIKMSTRHLEDAVLAGGEDWSSEFCEII